jgi:hypothetical protein
MSRAGIDQSYYKVSDTGKIDTKQPTNIYVLTLVERLDDSQDFLFISIVF